LQKRERDAEKEVTEDTQYYNGEAVLLQSHHSKLPFAAALRGKTEEQQQPRAHQMIGSDRVEPWVTAASFQHGQQKTGQSVRASNVNTLSLDKMMKVVATVLQQIMTGA
jgi:hypothetical protein